MNQEQRELDRRIAELNKDIDHQKRESKKVQLFKSRKQERKFNKRKRLRKAA